MNKNTILWLAIPFMVCFFAVGIPYWQIPYSGVSLPDALYEVGLLVVVIAAAVSRAFGNVRFRTAVLLIGASVPAAIFIRVAVEATMDPTSHNLWPFEIIIAAVVGVFCSLAGALAGSVLRYFTRRGEGVSKDAR